MIGGEFPIVFSDILKAEGSRKVTPDVFAYSSGRAALYQILNFLIKSMSVNRILLPDYLCGSVLVPVKTLGLDYCFYPINEELELKTEEFSKLYRNGTVVLLINYFGLKNLERQIDAVRSLNKEAIIIEDDVQAYYEFLKPLGSVDFKFTSLRKTFAIPDGGLVKTQHNLPKVNTPNTFGQYKAAAALLKSLRGGYLNDEVYLEMFKKGEDLIDNEIQCGMSHIAEKLYCFVNEKNVKERRINNANYLLEQLCEIGINSILPLYEGYVPLFIPIVLKNREKVRKAMFQQEIYCPVHWSLDELILEKGKLMAEQELSLIIDQRYGRKEMDEIVAVLKRNID